MLACELLSLASFSTKIWGLNVLPMIVKRWPSYPSIRRNFKSAGSCKRKKKQRKYKYNSDKNQVSSINSDKNLVFSINVHLKCYNAYFSTISARVFNVPEFQPLPCQQHYACYSCLHKYGFQLRDYKMPYKCYKLA